MIKSLLPIGSVVLLKEGKKRLMIYGINQKTEDGKIYDYLGCLYPEGNISPEYTYLFNEEAIDGVFYLGLVDSEFSLYRNKLQEIVDKPKDEAVGTESIKA